MIFLPVLIISIFQIRDGQSLPFLGEETAANGFQIKDEKYLVKDSQLSVRTIETKGLFGHGGEKELDIGEAYGEEPMVEGTVGQGGKEKRYWVSKALHLPEVPDKYNPATYNGYGGAFYFPNYNKITETINEYFSYILTGVGLVNSVFFASHHPFYYSLLFSSHPGPLPMTAVTTNDFKRYKHNQVEVE